MTRSQIIAADVAALLRARSLEKAPVVLRPLDGVTCPFLHVARAAKHLDILRRVRAAPRERHLVVKFELTALATVGAPPLGRAADHIKLSPCYLGSTALESSAAVSFGRIPIRLSRGKALQSSHRSLGVLLPSPLIVFPHLVRVRFLPAPHISFDLFSIGQPPAAITSRNLSESGESRFALIRQMAIPVISVPLSSPLRRALAAFARRHETLAYVSAWAWLTAEIPE